jgi:hypothetical protein
MTSKEDLQHTVNQIALFTIEKMLTSENIADDEARLSLIGYVVRAANQSSPELEYNV